MNGSIHRERSGHPAEIIVRYPASFNEFSVHGDFEAYRHKLTQARETFVGVYQSVKDKVDASLT
jgi:hypothetical protein